MTSRPGTYALLLASTLSRCLRIGRLGDLALSPGWYVYVGSAFGPGGVGARLAHHRKRAARPHWHIDHLRLHTQLERVWFTHDSIRREHQWAQVMQRLPECRDAALRFRSPLTARARRTWFALLAGRPFAAFSMRSVPCSRSTPPFCSTVTV